MTMKRISIMFMLAAFSMNTIICNAQKINSLTARCVKTEHKAAKKSAASAEGKFYYKAPDNMALVFKEGKEALLMTGTTYTIVRAGKKSVAKGEMIEVFKPLQTVLKTVFSQGDLSSLKKIQEVEMVANGNNTEITVTPSVNAKHSLFTSFIVTVNTKTCELLSIRMNERRNNYTDYAISSTENNASVNNISFK